MRKQLLLLLCVGSCLSFLATEAVSAQRVDAGLIAGMSAYSGDISRREFQINYQDIRPAGGAFLRLGVSKDVAVRMSFALGKVQAFDGESSDRGDRGLNFRSNITELIVVGEWDFFKIGKPGRFVVSPTVFAGIGLFTYNPEGFIDEQWTALQPIGTEGQGLPNPNYDDPYSLTQAVLPLGGGIKFFLGEDIIIGLEVGGRRTFSDYLDDVSDTEVNYLDVLQGNGLLAARLSNPSITNPTEAESLNYRRGGSRTDWYYITGINFSLRLGAAFKRPGKTNCTSW